MRGNKRRAAVAVLLTVGSSAAAIDCVGDDPTGIVSTPDATAPDSALPITPDSSNSAPDTSTPDANATDASDVDASDAAPDAAEAGIDAGTCATTCTVLASSQSNPTAIAVDGSKVFWVNSIATTGSVASCSISGCNNTPVMLATGQQLPISLSLDATHVYWANYDGNQINGILKDKSLPFFTVNNDGTFVAHPIGIGATTTGVVAWMDESGFAFYCNAGGTLPCAPSTAVGFAQTSVRSFTANAEHTSYVYARDTPSAVVYCGDATCNGGGGGATPVANLPQQITMAAGEIFYTVSTNPGAIYQASVTTALVGGLNRPWAITIDGNDIYFTTYSDGTVWNVPKTGGTATVMMTGLSHPNSLAVDSANVYVTSDDGRVIKISR